MLRGVEAFASHFIEFIATAQVKIVGFYVFGEAADDHHGGGRGCGLAGLVGQAGLQVADDGGGNLVLNLEDIRHFAVKTLRPQIAAIGNADELHADADPIAGFADTAFEDVGDVERFADLADILLRAAKDERGSSGGDT